MPDTNQAPESGPTEDEKDAQADGRAAEQETVDAANESGESKPGDTIEDAGGAVSLVEDSSGGEVRGQPTAEVRGQPSAGAVLDEHAFGGGNEAPPVTETNGDVDANAKRMNAGSEIAEGVTDESGDDETVDESDEDDDKDEDTGEDERTVPLEVAATLLGKFQALAKGEISREEARQWLEENYPE